MKGMMVVAAIVAITVVAGFAACVSTILAVEEGELAGLVVADLPVRAARDGLYEGECVLALKRARVRVLVEGGAVRSIEVLEEACGPGRSAAAVCDRVVAAQGLAVDAVSGSTKSSKVMLAAIADALGKALP